MAGEEQERFEDFLELQTFVAALETDCTARPPQNVTPEQARLYHMVVLFRSVSSQPCEPRPAFAAALWLRIERELRQVAKRSHPSPSERKRLRKGGYTVSRRSILTGSIAVAASLVAGAGIEHTLDQTRIGTESPTPVPAAAAVGRSPNAQTSALVPATVPATWHFVTTLATLGEHAVRFATDTVIGYVLMTNKKRNTGEGSPQEADELIAMSAVCTHLGCIVQWHDADRQFHCPCHGGTFAEDGLAVVAPGTRPYLLPLPRLETKVENGNVYVRVPVNKRKR